MRERGREHSGRHQRARAGAEEAATYQSSGSSCSSSSTGAKRSPWRSIRSSTSPASKTRPEPSPLSAARLDLVPGDRGRGGRALAGAQRVDGDRRFAAVVLGPVDEDLALAFDLFHLRDDQVRGLLFEQLGDRFGERFGRLVADLLGVERDVDLHPLRARGLGEALDVEVAEQVAQAQRHPAAVDDVGRRPGVEVEGEHGRPRRRPGQRERGVQLDRRQLRHPDQGRPAVADAEVDLAGVRPGPHVAVFTHFGRCLGQRFSKKAESRSSTPSGKRRRVTARPLRWGTIAGATLA